MRDVKVMFVIGMLIACAAQADETEAKGPVHFAVSLGSGLAQGANGFGFELRAGHFGAAVGAGVPLAFGLAEFGKIDSALGSLRFFNDGWLYSVNGGLLLKFGYYFNVLDDQPSAESYVHFWSVSLTAVRRFQTNHWFWQAGGGPLVVFEHDRDGKFFFPLVDLQFAGGYEF